MAERSDAEVPAADPAASETVEQARARLLAHLVEGTTCPCCGQFVKRYRRALNSAMARALVLLYRHLKANPGLEWVHTQSFLIAQQAYTGDFAKLRYWGLVEPQVGVRDDGSARVGLYRVTPLGEAFVRGTAHVMKYVYLYNDEVLARPKDDNEQISIHAALGERFNYTALMEG